MIINKFMEQLIKEFKEREYYNPLLNMEEPEYKADCARICQAVDLYGSYQLGNGDEYDYVETIACLMAILEEFITGSTGGSYFHNENRLIGYIQQSHVFFKALADSVYDKPVTVYVEPDEDGLAYVVVISQQLSKVLLNVSVKASGSWFDSIDEMEKFVSDCAYEIQNTIIVEEVKKKAVDSMNYLVLKAFELEPKTQEFIASGDSNLHDIKEMFISILEKYESIIMEHFQRIESRLTGSSIGCIKEIIAIEIDEGEKNVEPFAKYLEELDFPKLAELYRKIQAENGVAA